MRSQSKPDSKVVGSSAFLALVGLMMQIEDEVVRQRPVALLPGDPGSTTALTGLLVTNRRNGSADVTAAVLATEQITIWWGKARRGWLDNQLYKFCSMVKELCFKAFNSVLIPRLGKNIFCFISTILVQYWLS